MIRRMTAIDFVGALARFARPYRRSLWTGVAFMVLQSLVSLLLPWLGGRYAESLFGNIGNEWQLTSILLGLAALFSLQAILAIGGGFLLSKRMALILADVRMRTYSHLQQLPVQYFHQRKHGEILSLLNRDVWTLSGYLSGPVVGLVPAAVVGIGSMVLMFTLNPWMAFASIVAIPLFYVAIKLIGRKLRPISQALRDKHARAFAFEEENLSVLPAIKAATRESYELDRYRLLMRSIVDLTSRQQWREMAIGPGMVWAASMGVLAILWVAATQVGDGALAKGDLVSFLLYAALLTRPISQMASLYGETQHAIIAVERLEALYSESVEDYGLTRDELTIKQGEIHFDNVRFAYPGREEVFRNFNLTIEPGKVTALTGENGVGKSTLMSLLLRFQVPQSGQIVIDGKNVSEVTLASLREQIGYVSQNVDLINASVKDNIAFARPNASVADIVRAAALAQATQFIEALPDGMDTMIGDHGIRLSGGQRQRIALARELLRNPKILVLDEATSMFDPDAELSFLRDAREALTDRTVILITHRPASLSLAHKVLRLGVGEKHSPIVKQIVPSLVFNGPQ
jgi:ATP-binding cassette, subfamily B, bacterial